VVVAIVIQGPEFPPNWGCRASLADHVGKHARLLPGACLDGPQLNIENLQADGQAGRQAGRQRRGAEGRMQQVLLTLFSV
jgi:hypothetical protein